MAQCSIYVIPGPDRKRYDLAERCPNEAAPALDVCEMHSTTDGIRHYPRDDGRTYAWNPADAGVAEGEGDPNQIAARIVRKATEGK